MNRLVGILFGIGVAACTGSGSSSNESELDHKACQQSSECGPNPAATCAHICSDQSNPCVYVCRDFHCVMRGCPGDVDAGPPDAAVTQYEEGDSCDDGLACAAGLLCTSVGDPCPTYPNCKVCYVPCGPGGLCPSGYRTCIPQYGQGGNVCIK
jgi:hypothetical protein